VARQSSDNGDEKKHEKEVSSEATKVEDAITADGTETAARDDEPAPMPEDESAIGAEDAKNPASETDETPDASAAEVSEAEAGDTEDKPLAGDQILTEAEADDGTSGPATDSATSDETAEIEDAVEIEDQAGAQTDAEHAPGSEPEPEPEPEPQAQPAPTPQTVVERRGPGFVPLVLGGVVAAGLGYFASVGGLLPGLGDPAPSPEVEAALNQQAETLAALQEQIAALGAAEASNVDLGPVTDELSGLAARIDDTAAAIAALSDRVVTLEERPVFSGNVTADAAEAAEAVAAMEEQMRQREEEAAARAAEAEAAAQAARDAAAAAQAEAEAAMALAQAEAALNALRLAVTRGEPFAGPLDSVAAIIDVPEVLSDTAASGVSSLEELQSRFPAAARAALPVALRETAGDSPVDRFAAFVQGQVGGRAVEPREGDDVDAILSRAQGAVTAGDLDTALAEIATLPEGAQAELAAWTADAQARNAVLAALQTVTQALAGAN
jgi:hypothetical protein